jgi:hypothetical protein
MTDKQRKRLENMDTLLHTEGEHMENSTAWIIQDFSNLLETKKVGERKESPIYRVYQCHDLASPAILFKIVCFPSGVTEENRGYVSMKIETCGLLGQMTVNCDLSLINTEGKDCFKRRIRDGHSIPRFISHKELAVHAGKLLSEDQLIVNCSHDLGLRTYSRLLWNSLAPRKVEKCVHWPGKDLLSSLDDNPDKYSTYPHLVWLQLADGKLHTSTFPLAAHSESFRDMFHCDPKKIYSFPEMNVKTGKELLFFLYTGQMKEDADVMELLVVADKFLIGSLKDACVRILKRSLINDNNWKEFIQLGNLCNVDHLKQLGIEHFKKFGRRIVKKPGWNEELSTDDHAALIELFFS